MSLRQNSAKIIFLKLFFLFLFFVLLFLLIYLFYPEKLGLEPLFHTLGREPSMTGRSYLWSRGFNAFLSKSIWGWGYDSNTSVLSKKVIRYGQFHNGYLNVAVAGGIIGFIFLLALILRALKLCIKLLKSHFEIATAFLVMLLAMMIHDIAESSFFSPTNSLWLMFVYSLFYLDHLTHS